MTTGGAHDRLLGSLRRRAAHPAVVWDGRSYTFEEIRRLANLYVDRLRALGVRRGARVAVFAETCPELIAGFVAHLETGVVHVPINTRYKADEARHILEDSGAVAVLTGGEGEECREVLGEILRVKEPPGLRHVLTVADAFRDGQPASAAPSLPSSPSSKKDLSSSPTTGDEPSDDDIAMLIYTSGTTGKSKGVALSYRALADNTASVTGLWRFAPEDRLVLALPLFHVHGLVLGVAGMLVNGLTLLLEPRFDAARIAEAFAREGATVFMGVPTMYVRLLEHLGVHPEAAAALRKARLFTAGSAPLPAADFEAFHGHTGHAILERYGMSETLFTLSNPYDGERRPGTVGRATPGCSVRIVDDEGRDVPDGDLGEIVVKSNGLMNAYWGREADTAASFRDGWFLTGDVARRSADGYVTIAGRKSVDIIKSGGYKVAAREIEDVLRRHPSVRDAAVVGVEDRVWGQRVAAALVLAEGCEPITACAEVAAFAAAHLADYKKPRDVVALPELPRNALGKVQKHLLARAFGPKS
ncbi:MAG TPA: AMP-binding protein [Thermoanaerobaculia bacterium]|nr:AMP-binding protein [Thermoanaerobaculia bacterium]